MFKKEISRRLLITFIWLVIISLLRWHWHLPVSKQVVNLVLLWLGGLLGTFLLDVDHLLYALIIYPQEITSLRVRRLIDQRLFKEALVLLGDTQGERIRLSFHTAFFQPILCVLCFFVITSTGSLFGSGLVLAIALHLLVYELTLLFQGKEEELHQRLFWQIKKEISFNQQKAYVVIMLLIFLWLNFLLI